MITSEVERPRGVTALRPQGVAGKLPIRKKMG
jgi:hypothetical protein